LPLLQVPPVYAAIDLVVIEAITNIHAGVGRVGGVVDLPVQRDELGFPCIYSSSLKGALKTALLQAFVKIHGRNYRNAKNAVATLLGSEPEEGETFESSIAVLDAYLLAMPVRSLKGVYVYVTSPLLLKRFQERIALCCNISPGTSDKLEKLMNDINIVLNEVKNLNNGGALCIGNKGEVALDKPKNLQGKVVLAEEFVLEVNGIQSNLKDELGLDKPLLVLHDDTAREVINRSLVRLTRVRLRRDTKTVEAGPWTEEYLPVKTRLFTLFLYKRPPVSRIIKDTIGKDNVSYEDYLQALSKLGLIDQNSLEELKNAAASSPSELQALLAEKLKNKVADIIMNKLRSFIIVGGNETIGKGIVKLTIL